MSNGAVSGINAVFQKNDISCLHIAAAMGGVFGFFMGSFSQMSTPMMNASGPIVEPGKASVGSEVAEMQCV